MGFIFDPKCKLELYAGTSTETVEDLHMEFDVNLSSLSFPNTAEITVYNLDYVTRHIFEEYHQQINFYAGYRDEINLIFSGYTINVISEREETTWKTTIYAREGIREVNEKTFEKTYKKGTTVYTIMSDMLTATGLPYKIDSINEQGTSISPQVAFEQKILQSNTYNDKIKDCLTQICNDFDYEWTVLHDVIEVRKKGSSFHPGSTAVVISNDTGMIGDASLQTRSVDEPKTKTNKPKKIRETVKTGSTGSTVTELQNILLRKGYLSSSDVDGTFGSATKAAVVGYQNDKLLKPADGIVGKDTWEALIGDSDEKRVRVDSIVKVALNPEIKPGRFVLIKSRNITKRVEFQEDDIRSYGANGVFLVNSVNFYGDNFGGDFVAEVNASIPINENDTRYTYPVVYAGMEFYW